MHSLKIFGNYISKVVILKERNNAIFTILKLVLNQGECSINFFIYLQLSSRVIKLSIKNAFMSPRNQRRIMLDKNNFTFFLVVFIIIVMSI